MNCPGFSGQESRLPTGANSASRANAPDLHQFRDGADASPEPSQNRIVTRGIRSKRGAPAARARHCS